MLTSLGSQAMLFEPGYLKVNLGDKVIFKPTDLSHNSQSVLVPEGANIWNSKNNKDITISFDKEGIYIYECRNHFMMAMVGVIQVGRAINLDQAKDFAKNYKSKFFMNKDRLDKYLQDL